MVRPALIAIAKRLHKILLKWFFCLLQSPPTRPNRNESAAPFRNGDVGEGALLQRILIASLKRMQT